MWFAKLLYWAPQITTTTSFHILSISFFIGHPNIWHIVWATDNIIKQTIGNEAEGTFLEKTSVAVRYMWFLGRIFHEIECFLYSAKYISSFALFWTQNAQKNPSVLIDFISYISHCIHFTYVLISFWYLHFVACPQTSVPHVSEPGILPVSQLLSTFLPR
jgi:hypothetical protein